MRMYFNLSVSNKIPKFVFFTIILVQLLCAYTDPLGNLVNQAPKVRDEADYTTADTEIPTVIMEVDTVRALAELNIAGEADAYPWISADGLRLYYSQGEDTKICIAKRSNVSENFSAPETLPLFRNDSVDCFSAWLTADEKTMFYIRRDSTSGSRITSLYCTSRLETSVDFDSTWKINIVGDVSGFISGPSLTQDLQHLFLYNSDRDGIENIISLYKTDENEYTIKDTLTVPPGYSIAPGQLSIDGNRYYCTLDQGVKSGRLAVYSGCVSPRRFENISILDLSSFDEMGYDMNQPTISADGKHLFFVNSPQVEWKHNDLYYAYQWETQLVQKFALNRARTVAISRGRDNLQFVIDPLYAKDAVLKIYDAAGRLRERVVNADGTVIVLSSNALQSGLYFYELKTEIGHSVAGKFVF